MTRTSKALRRLGVAGVVAATIGAGVPAFFATAASAATTTGITLSPKSQAATQNTCVAYTAQITPAEAKTVDVQISQTTTTGTTATPATAPVIGFCDPDGPGPATAPANTTRTAASPSNAVNTNPGPTCAAGTNGTIASPQGTTTCDAEFTTSAGGAVTFGVVSDTVGTVNITAFVEDNPANPSGGTATPATGNATGNNVPNVGEQADTATLTVVASGNSSVKKITCTPTTRTAAFGGSSGPYTCTAYTTDPSSGQNTLAVSGATLTDFVTSGPDVNQSNACTATANPGESTCAVTNGGIPGTDNVLVYAEQNSVAGPQASETSTNVTAVFVGGARNIACSPTPATATVGSEYTVDCAVTDVNGKAVPSKSVLFTHSGVGRYSNLNCYTGNTCVVATGTDGHTQVSVTSSVPGTSTVKAELSNGSGMPDSTVTTSECNSPAGSTRNSSGALVTATGSTAGKCDATVNVNFVQAASPSPSPSASTPPASTPPPTRQALSLVINTPTITAGQLATLTVTGAPSQGIQLECYTRPSVTYSASHATTINAAGDPVVYKLALGRNTRCFAEYTTNPAQGFSAQGVINVKTAISIFPVRKGVRNYVFQGHNLPKYTGQLITLYYVNSAGETVRKGNVQTDDTGIYYVPVKFLGTGTFTFYVRTGQTLNNAAGESAHVAVTIH